MQNSTQVGGSGCATSAEVASKKHSLRLRNLAIVAIVTSRVGGWERRHRGHFGSRSRCRFSEPLAQHAYSAPVHSCITLAFPSTRRFLLPAAMEPSAREFGGPTTVASVCQWIGMPGDLQKALCEHTGIAEDGPPRRLATIAGSDVNESKTAIKLDAATLEPCSNAMVGEAWRCQAGRRW